MSAKSCNDIKQKIINKGDNYRLDFINPSPAENCKHEIHITEAHLEEVEATPLQEYM